MTQEYLIRLTETKAALSAVTLDGAGALATLGNEVKAALQVAVGFALEIDSRLIHWLQTQGIETLATAKTQQWVNENAQSFTSPTEKVNRTQDRFFEEVRAIIRTKVAAYCQPFSTQGITVALDWLAKSDAFDAAIASFAGDPEEKAVAEAARASMLGVSERLHLRPVAASGVAVNASWLATTLTSDPRR